MNDSELANKARGVACCLSYNNGEHEDAAKRLLREMAHRLDAKNIRVHKKRDGFLIASALGSSRYMTLKESLAYRMFGAIPAKV